ncbi:MAG: MoaD/ThiS family protein [Anaerolineaceae bacterium]
MAAEINNTVSVTVRMMGFLQKLSEGINPQLQVQSGTSIYELLDRYTLQGKEELRTALWDSRGQLNGGLELILNGQVIAPSQMRDTKISQDSEITLIPVIAGGEHNYPAA